MSEPLKPCPFCGCSAFVNKPDRYGWWIVEGECGCEGPYCDDPDDEKARATAIEFWNNRTPDARLASLRPRIEELLRTCADMTDEEINNDKLRLAWYAEWHLRAESVLKELIQ